MKRDTKFQPHKITAVLFLAALLTISAGTVIRQARHYVSEHKRTREIVLQDAFIELNGGWRRLLGQKIVTDADTENTVYMMDNGMLTFWYADADQHQNVESTAKLKVFLDQRQIDFLYVQAPFKIDKYDNQLPYNISDATNQNADIFLSGLMADGVPFLDLRDYLGRLDIDCQDQFYKTDHHWKANTAFLAHQEVLRELERIYGYDFDEEKYDRQAYKEKHQALPWIGSQGRRVGVTYGGVDSFEYLLPLFETNLHMEVYNREGDWVRDVSGSFEEVFLRPEILESGSKTDNRYASFFGNDYHLVKIRNEEGSIDKKILLIQDSFGRPFSAYMALHFTAVDILDLRDYSASLLTEYIEDNEFDCVAVLYNPGSLRYGESEEMFRFE